MSKKELMTIELPRLSSRSSPLSQTIVVLGAAGTIGQVIAWDWIQSSKRHRVILADRDEVKVKLLKKKLGARASAYVIDLFKPAQLRSLLRHGSLVVNSTSHHFNLHVMAAALHANVHYLDLGGLFHFTRKQLKWQRRFAEIGKTAILGIGCAPGISNIMAAALTEDWEKVESLEVRVGGVGPEEPSQALPYSWKTLYEELTLKPAVFTRGKWTFVSPLSGSVKTLFSKPIGEQKVFYTLHSEVATLPLFFESRGIREVSFRIGLGEDLQQLVLHGKPPLPIKTSRKKAKVVPKKLAVDYESTMVIARGIKNGKAVEQSIQFMSKGNRKWRAGDLNTACPASITAQLILEKAITAPGVWAPEEIVPWKGMKSELEKRGFSFICNKQSI